ncbi:LamG-like jellyroll fold domain-containing protein [Actinoplanes solisilvae]|uniref:LamG-like jellyroll fold domain-containing protein n=1 Tax=Actinoplanes solisilvae TaxID=2486853 RepID=UPI000FDADA7D|nr:LamG-like jellyroll fold domain-containing protein [Actinoplanes solisilvae]
MSRQDKHRSGTVRPRRRFASAAAAVLCSTTFAVAVSTTSAEAAPSPAPAPKTAPSLDSAAKAAKKSGKRVEALSERTEFVQVFAEPSGKLRYEAAAVPQRVKKTNGSWADIDVKLAKGEDKLLRPKATLADVRFSAGGTGPAATLVQDNKKLTLTWPHGKLPAPTVAADAATYSEVLPGVDLVLRATRTGFTHVLVVKNAQAAANPAVREVRFDLGGDAKAQRLADGSLRAVADGKLLAAAPAPEMWDSSATGTSAAAKAAVSAGTIEKSSSAAPGDLAKSATVRTELTSAGDLVLRPDAAVLSPAAKFPVYIDPAWSTGKSRWAYATHNNTNNTDVSRARVGSDPDGRTYRSFFDFPISGLAGYHIEDAYVQMKVDHSWSCTKTPNSLYQAGSFGTPRASYSTSLVKFLATVSSNANEGTGCDDSPQPDMIVNFNTDAVKSVVNALAAKSAPNVVFGLSARSQDGSGESEGNRWKKYFPADAKLIVDRDAKPTIPTQLQVNGVACTGGTIRIGTTTPYFSAVVNDKDGTAQNLTATWQLFNAPDGENLTARTSPGDTSSPANTRATSARTGALPANQRYAFRVYTKDPAPYEIKSPTSATCYFVVDTTVPPVKVETVTGPAGPGKPGTFKISSTATDVSSFQYGWNEATTSSVAATNILDSAGKVIGKQATVTAVVKKYGIAVLYARAIDSTNNKGYGSTEITVPRPSTAVADWSLEIRPPWMDEEGALLDEAPAVGGDNVLTPTNLGWADKGRIIQGKNVNFTGTTSLTTPKVVDTTKSYSVAAFARLDNLNGVQTLLSQDGANTANFELTMRSEDLNLDGTADKSWCFGMRSADSTTNTLTKVCAVNTAVAGRWTHVAGSYDSTAKTMTIWVDGVAKFTDAAPTAWTANSLLRIGNRKNTSTQYVEPLYGSVADVQIFDRVMVRDDFTGTAAEDEFSGGFDEPGILAATSVGIWDFEAAAPCAVAGTPNTCEAPDSGSGFGRQLTLTPGTEIGPGISESSGLLLDNKHMNDGSATKEYGWSQRDVAPVGSPDKILQNEAVLRTDQSFAVSVWVQPAELSSTMTAVAQQGSKMSAFYLGVRESTVKGITGKRFEVMVPSIDNNLGEAQTHLIAPTLLSGDDTSDWFHLVFVYNTSAVNQLSLYVNGEMEATRSGVLWSADGPLTVGSVWHTMDEETQGSYRDQWIGGIDNLQIWQGVLTAGQFNTLFEATTKSLPIPRQRTDYNNDGNADFAAIGASRSMGNYAGNGSGLVRFSTDMGPVAGAWGPDFTRVTAGDFNDDGNNDIVAIGADGNIRVYRGDGDGFISTGRTMNSVAGAWGGIVRITAGDFDGDGLDDIVGTGSDGNIRMYKGDGDSGIGTGDLMYQTGAGWNGFRTIIGGDFNGDGTQDIAGIGANGSLWFYAGNGAGRLSPGASMYGFPEAFATHTRMTAGDYNNDGRVDLAAINPEGNLVYFRNNGNAYVSGGILLYQKNQGWGGVTAVPN